MQHLVRCFLGTMVVGINSLAASSLPQSERHPMKFLFALLLSLAGLAQIWAKTWIEHGDAVKLLVG
jgi:hypothetical protein